MAAAPKGDRQRPLQETQAAARRAEPGPSTKGRRGPKWRRRAVLAAVVVAAVVVWLLPAIVAHSPLLHWFLRSATRLRGAVSARSASLGWFSPSSLTGVEVRDQQGQLLLEIPRLETDRSLLAILWNRADWGRVRLESPTLWAELREEGSNVEDVLAAYLARERQAGVSVELEIVDGGVVIGDLQRQQSWQIEKLQLTFHRSGDKTTPRVLQASGQIADATDPGRFVVKLSTHPSGANTNGVGGSTADRPSDELTIDTEAVPLAMLQAVLDRFSFQTELAGRLSSTIRCQWNGQPGTRPMAIEGRATAQDVTLAAPQLNGDRLDLRRVDVGCRAAWHDGQLQVEQLALQSDIGEASLLGTFDSDGPSVRDLLAGLPNQVFELDARIDLAELTATLPTALRVRQGTQVTSGQLRLGLAGNRGSEGMCWRGQITTSNLTAVDHGRSLVWEQPILLTLTAHQGPEGPIVDSLLCESDFLKIDAAGTSRHLTASASFDLNRLADQLGRFVDLGGVHFGGDGSAQFNWRRSGQDAFEADGWLRVHEFELALAGRRPWKEDRLTATFSATGRTGFAADTRVDAASLALEAGSEWLEARLIEPMPNLRGGPWPLEVRSTGELAGWQARLGFGSDWSLAGTYDLHAEAQYSAGVTAAALTTTIDDLVATHRSGRQIREARIRLTGRGSYDGGPRSVRLEQAQLHSTAVGIDAAGQIALQDPEAEIQLAGQMACDMERLSQWLGPYTADGVRLAGRGSQPVSYDGPLSPQTARADAAMGWDAGEIYGFAVGPGALRATLSEGILQFQPVDLGVSEGRLRLAAQVGLASKPVRLEVEPGRLFDQVRINPDMCHRALKYIAPVLAGVTSAEGRFSVDLDACRIPFSDPGQGELAGRMTIHSVRIGPGPLIQGLIEPLALLPGRTPSAELSRESVVSFHMADDRMYHRDLELVFGDVTIRTQGSVGLDQSLAVVAEIAVSPKLRTSRPLLETILREPRIRVPITGTLSKPVIDRQALRQMNEQFLKDAARDMLREGLNRGLQRLFDPPE